MPYRSPISVYRRVLATAALSLLLGACGGGRSILPIPTDMTPSKHLSGLYREEGGKDYWYLSYSQGKMRGVAPWSSQWGAFPLTGLSPNVLSAPQWPGSKLSFDVDKDGEPLAFKTEKKARFILVDKMARLTVEKPGAEDLVGQWQGTLERDAKALPVVLKIERTPNGRYRGLFSEGSGIAGTVSRLNFTGGVLDLEVSSNDGLFVGTLDPSGRAITGHWCQQGIRPLALKRVGLDKTVKWRTFQRPDLFQQADKRIKPLIDKGGVHGVVVGMTSLQGRQIRAYGVSSPSAKLPLDGKSIFEIGSITKVFTALLALDLAAQGKLDLEAPIRTYLPSGQVLPKVQGREILLKHLIQHSSGIPERPMGAGATFRYLLSLPLDDLFSDFDEKELSRTLASTKLNFAPGDAVQYSNVNYAVLTQVIESQSGRSYEERLQERICRPLGMTDTSTGWAEGQRERAVQGHTMVWNKNAAFINFKDSLMRGAGAIHSTTDDMLIFAEALTQGTRPELMRQATQLMGLWEGFGTGGIVAGGAVLVHGGSTLGFESQLIVDPAEKVGLIAFSNRLYPQTSYAGLNLYQAMVRDGDGKELPVFGIWGK